MLLICSKVGSLICKAKIVVLKIQIELFVFLEKRELAFQHSQSNADFTIL